MVINNPNIEAEESSRGYALFYSFFLIPLMIVIFGILFYLLFSVITEEPTDINQLLIKLETGSMRDKSNASYNLNKLFFEDQNKYDTLYRQRIIRIHEMSRSQYFSDETLRLHTIMIMGNSGDTEFGDILIEELSSDNKQFKIKAIESLGKLKHYESSNTIIKFLERDNIFLEKLAAVGALGNIGNKSAINPLIKLIESWPQNWLDSDGPELRWEASISLLKLGYVNDNTQNIINNLLDRNYLATVKNYNEANQKYNELDQNTIDFVLMKILTIINSIEDLNLILFFDNNIYNLSEFDSNLEIRNFSKKLYRRFK